GASKLAAIDMSSGSGDPTTVATSELIDYPVGFRGLSASGSRLGGISPPDGAARVADLPHVGEQPRFLGNPIAPASFDPRDGEWNAEFVTSLAMPTCALTIASGDTPV